jgi:hypothetical protein
MRNTTRSRNRRASRSCEFHVTIRLPRGKKIAIERELESILDALAVDESVAHVDAVFFRIYRGTKKG